MAEKPLNEKLDLINSYEIDLIELINDMLSILDKASKLGHINSPTAKGLNKIAEELMEGRSYSIRATVLHNKSIGIRAAARKAFKAIENYNQDVMDNIITNESHKYLDRSWSERESLYRVKCIPSLSYFRRASQIMEQIEGLTEQITTLAVGLYRSFRDMELVIRVIDLEARISK